MSYISRRVYVCLALNSGLVNALYISANESFSEIYNSYVTLLGYAQDQQG